MPELTNKDAINLMLKYYHKRFPDEDLLQIVTLLSKADVIGLVIFAYNQGKE